MQNQNQNQNQELRELLLSLLVGVLLLSWTFFI